MAKIVPKLNLNKTPQAVENYSMIYAKNIKLLKDNTIGRDDGIDLIDQTITAHDGTELTEYHMIGFIPYNTKIFIFYATDGKSYIFSYDEEDKTFTEVESSWKWSYGIIDGYVTVNLRSETLLTIIEHFDNVTPETPLVPIKTINIDESSYDDDESVYTQVPNLGLLNLNLVGTYNNIIPNGVYQFFARYEIKKDLYSSWFPVSKECFTANIYENDTAQGSVRYIDVKEDSNNSFIFNVERINTTNVNYLHLQIGFILSHDDEIVARSWKKFSPDVNTIYFDYEKDYIEEIDIVDLINPIFGLYNVKNLTSFKNKLYISNYIESNYNEDLTSYAKNWKVDIERANMETTSTYSYRGYVCQLDQTTFDDQPPKDYISHFGGNTIGYWINKDKDTLLKSGSSNLFKVSKSALDITNVQYQPLQQTVQANSESEAIDAFNNLTNRKDYKGISRQILDSNVKLSVYNGSIKIAEDIDTVYADNVSAGTDTTFNSVVIDWLARSVQGFELENLNAIYYTDSDGRVSDNTFRVSYTRSTLIPTLLSNNTYSAQIKTEIVTITYGLSLYRNDLVFRNDVENINQTTLVPYQGYKFYIHYVKATGEITNGYYIGETIVNYVDDLSTHKIIYPKFTNNGANPDGYIGYFFSIYKYKNKICELFNPKGIQKDEEEYWTFDCLEIDTLEIPIHKNITIIIPESNKTLDKLTKYSAIYVDSGDMKKPLPELFGASGKVLIENTNPSIDMTTKAFLIIENEKNEDNIILTKCTPYYSIDNKIVANYQNYNMVDYICKVSKNIQNEFDFYLNGNDGYEKTVIKDGDQYIVDLNSVDTKIDNKHTDSRYIYSNFNLNFLELTNDIKYQLRNYKEGNESKHQMINGFDSLTLSDLYTHPSMYKNYTRKQFYVYDANAFVKFDNTLRSSVLEGDEAKTYIYKFDINDYYNVPTEKGFITNIAAIGDMVLVHTQDSMFKFTGKPALSNDGSDVQTKESEIFDTGIQEIIGSEHGFAGLKHKDHSMLSQFGYIFWDSDANVIYFYAGQGELAPISDPIHKLLNYNKPTDIRFCCDYYNDRFITRIKYSNAQVTLSYNIKAKSFISLHDYSFDYCFNTKSHTYLIRKLLKIETSKGGLLGIITPDKYLYNVGTRSFHMGNDLYPNKQISDDKTKYAVIDIICNDTYETIKTLDSISWICSEIEEKFIPSKDLNIEDVYLAEESLDRTYAGDYICIYSDSSATRLIDILKASNEYALYQEFRHREYNEVKEEERPINPLEYPSQRISESYMLPRYNLGKWSYNYFRNILNTENKTNVPTNTPGYMSDQQSLIYGKYFVVRFLFNPAINFKFENLSLNITGNPYGNA